MGDLSPAKAQSLAKATAAAAAKRKLQTHCSKGHPFSPENLKPRKDGRRQCKICYDDYRTYSRMKRRIELDRDPDDPRHGTTTGYNIGCKCFRCRVAMSEHRRAKYDPARQKEKRAGWRRNKNSSTVQQNTPEQQPRAGIGT